MTERRVEREDIERYRRALVELGGEASLQQLAEHAGQGETELGYIAACLIVPTSTKSDSEAFMPFAIPSAEGVDVEGRQLWRTEEHWTADDLEEARRFLGSAPGRRRTGRRRGVTRDDVIGERKRPAAARSGYGKS